MSDFRLVDSSVSAQGTIAGVPIVVFIPAGENAIVSAASVFLDGLCIDGDSDLQIVTEERLVGDTSVTVVTGVQAGAALATNALMRLVVEFGDMQVVS